MSENQDQDYDLEKPKIKVPVLFDSDLTKSPCFRTSMLNSLSISFGFGITRFMFTSNVKKSVKLALNTFAIANVLIFIGCKYFVIQQKNKVYQLEPTFQSRAKLYGEEEENKNFIQE